MSESSAKVVDYHLTIQDSKINITGKDSTALLINNTLPGPTLKAQVGDILKVSVKNNLPVETSIHWHGVLVPNIMDGVPYITTPPIKPGETFFYEFPIKHAGTYWYHAHSALQEQQGVYGALVFTQPEEDQDFDEEYVIVLSDWTDENPEQVLANLKKDSDYYALKKDAVQSWVKILENGFDALKIRLKNAFERMTPMDLSDVGYDAFLMNGQPKISLSKAKPGTRIKLRVISAASSTYFILEYSGGPMKLIESDGVKIKPLSAQRLKISMAETYDLIVTVPENKTFEFRASAEDGTGYTSALIGQGTYQPAPTLPKPNLVLMDHMGHSGMNHQMMADHSMNEMPPMEHMDHEQISDHQALDIPKVEFVGDYQHIKATAPTILPKDNALRIIDLKLTGSMERYVWSINNTPMFAADKIPVKRGENIRLRLINETMMSHPIHLHGHFFRVLNGQGDYSPLKHTVNVPPFQTIEIEFEADKEKDWIFHCHNLYHMKLGMGGTIHYVGTKSYQDVSHHRGDHSADHGNQWFQSTHLHGYSNLATAQSKLMRNNDYFVLDLRHNLHKDYEHEAFYQHYTSEFFGFYAGGKFKHEKHKRENLGIFGLAYTLPMLIKADLRFPTKGKVRLAFWNEHQLTDRLSFDWNWNTDKEYMFGLHFALTKQLEISGNYDSRERFGLGLSFKF